MEGGRQYGAAVHLDHGARLAGAAIDDEEAGAVGAPQYQPSTIGRDVEKCVELLRRPHQMGRSAAIGRLDEHLTAPLDPVRVEENLSTERRNPLRAARRAGLQRSDPRAGREVELPLLERGCIWDAGRNRNMLAVQRETGTLKTLHFRRYRLDRTVAPHPYQASQPRLSRRPVDQVAGSTDGK